MKAGAVFLAFVIFGFVVFMDREPARYDCRTLIGAWHPDVPQKVIDQCRGLKHDV